MYHHGYPEGFRVYSLTGLRLTLANFTNDPNKKENFLIREKDVLSIMTLEYDNDHNEILTINRGKIIDISTNGVGCNMSNDDMVKHIIIKIDCSTEGHSDIRYICAYNIVEVHEVDYEYSEIPLIAISVDIEKESWKVLNDKHQEIDLTSSVEFKEDK